MWLFPVIAVTDFDKLLNSDYQKKTYVEGCPMSLVIIS